MTRPSAPLISLDRTVKATLDVIERNGLENLTLRNLATKLGVSAPSLYHHFANKTEVLRAAAKELVRDRSEEHTSELQSLMPISYAVFCLTKTTHPPPHPPSPPPPHTSPPHPHHPP